MNGVMMIYNSQLERHPSIMYTVLIRTNCCVLNCVFDQ